MHGDEVWKQSWSSYSFQFISKLPYFQRVFSALAKTLTETKLVTRWANHETKTVVKQAQYYKDTFLSSEGSYEPDPDGVKLQRLLEVENLLVNEYAGDIRAKINAMAG